MGMVSSGTPSGLSRSTSCDQSMRSAASHCRCLPFSYRVSSRSRTAFYRHFADRRDLVVRLVRDLADELWAMSEGWLQGAGEPLAEAREAIERLADVYQEHGRLLLAIAEAA